MTKPSSVVRHGDRLLSEPRPLGSGTGSITYDRFLTGAAFTPHPNVSPQDIFSAVRRESGGAQVATSPVRGGRTLATGVSPWSRKPRQRAQAPEGRKNPSRQAERAAPHGACLGIHNAGTHGLRRGLGLCRRWRGSLHPWHVAKHVPPQGEMGSRTRPRSLARRRGFSMVEAVFCVVLVGGLVVVSLDTLGASKVAQRSLGDRTRGSLLASALMSEILSQSYEDPNQSPIWGRESGESPLLRSTFDDVDDYINWSASPPLNRDGTSIPGLSGWRQSVTVDWVDQSDLNTPWVSGSGVKRVTVTITHNNVVVATLVGVKTGTPTGSLPV